MVPKIKVKAFYVTDFMRVKPTIKLVSDVDFKILII